MAQSARTPDHHRATSRNNIRRFRIAPGSDTTERVETMTDIPVRPPHHHNYDHPHHRPVPHRRRNRLLRRLVTRMSGGFVSGLVTGTVVVTAIAVTAAVLVDNPGNTLRITITDSIAKPTAEIALSTDNGGTFQKTVHTQTEGVSFGDTGIQIRVTTSAALATSETLQLRIFQGDPAGSTKPTIWCGPDWDSDNNPATPAVAAATDAQGNRVVPAGLSGCPSAALRMTHSAGQTTSTGRILLAVAAADTIYKPDRDLYIAGEWVTG